MAKGTRLITADFKFVNVEDVKEGDLLLGPDGTPRKVRQLVSGKERLIRIVPDCRGSVPDPELEKRTLRCTTNHIVVLDELPSVNDEDFVSTSASRPKADADVDTKRINVVAEDMLDMNTQDLRSVRLVKPRDGLDFPSQPVPISPWFLGFCLADGSSMDSSDANDDEREIQDAVLNKVAVPLSLSMVFDGRVSCKELRPETYVSRYVLYKRRLAEGWTRQRAVPGDPRSKWVLYEPGITPLCARPITPPGSGQASPITPPIDMLATAPELTPPASPAKRLAEDTSDQSNSRRRLSAQELFAAQRLAETALDLALEDAPVDENYADADLVEDFDDDEISVTAAHRQRWARGQPDLELESEDFEDLAAEILGANDIDGEDDTGDDGRIVLDLPASPEQPRLRRNELWRRLKDLGVVKREAGAENDSKRVPECIMRNSRKVRMEFLAGFIDGDGSFSPGTNTYQITQSLESHSDLIDGLMILIRSLGWWVHARVISGRTATDPDGKEYTSSDSIVISFRPDEDLPCVLGCKFSEKRSQKVSNHFAIKSVELEKEETEWFGFKVDKDNCYLRDDFLILHNSGFEGGLSVSVEQKS